MYIKYNHETGCKLYMRMLINLFIFCNHRCHYKCLLIVSGCKESRVLLKMFPVPKTTRNFAWDFTTPNYLGKIGCYIAPIWASLPTPSGNK